MRVRRAAVLVIVAAIGAASCGGVGPSKNVTETFSGTLTAGQLDYHEYPFNVGKSGEYSVTYTLSPAVNVFLYVYFGLPDPVLGCQSLQENTLAAPGHAVLSGAIDKGTWCVGIQDLGVLTQNEQFTMTVSHP